MIFSPRRKTLAVCLAVLGLFLTADTTIRLMGINAMTAVQTSDTLPGALKISPGGWERTQILPPASLDARWWVIHTENFLRGNSLRVRATDLDNAPVGREVHWSSSLIWLLAALAGIISAWTGQPAVNCVAQAACWAGPVLLVGCLAVLGVLAARRFGPGLAGIFLLIFGTSPMIFQGFRAGETDHHGLVCALATGSILALVAGGGGLVRRDGKKNREWPDRDSARGWFLFSGGLGGAALWVSAASFIPILVGCALGAVAVVLPGLFRALQRTRSAGQALNVAKTAKVSDAFIAVPSLWRIWAVAGCISSLFFYALEYFPHHMGWRLEVNHPLYALAWLGAGDLLARILGKVEAASGSFPPQKKRLEAASPFTLIASLLALLVPVILIMANPRDFFLVADRFVLLLHNEYIQEFQSFPRYLKDAPGLIPVLQMIGWPLFVLAGAGWLIARGELAKEWRALLALALAPALVMQALAFYQIRWAIMATGLWTVCVVVLLAGFWQSKTRSRWFAAVSTAWIVVASLAFPLVSLVSLSQAATLTKSLPKIVIPTLLLRDVSHRLVQSSPDRLPIVLSGPTSSTDLTYYAGIKTLGTLYWENRDGLRHAARLFDSPTEKETKALLLQSGVSHIVVSSWDDFGRGYAGLLRRAEGRDDDKNGGYLERILQETVEPPDWLRPLSYPIPSGFGVEGQRVKIFQVLPAQSRTEALINQALYWRESGKTKKARALLEEALGMDPANETARQWLDAIRREEG